LNLFEFAIQHGDLGEGLMVVRGMQSQQNLVDLVEEIVGAGEGLF